MLRFIAFALLISVVGLRPVAWAIEGMGNPWETIDDAICAMMKTQDFSVVLGRPVTVMRSERVAAVGAAPGYCHIRAVFETGTTLEAKLPVSGWNGRVLALDCGLACDGLYQRRLDDALAVKSAIGLSTMSGETPPDTAAFLAEAVRLYYNRTP